MNIRPVKTEGDYELALERIESLWGAKANTQEGNELDILLTLVSVYENEHHTVPQPNPIEAIKFVIDQQGLNQSDLVPFIGSRSKVSEVLSGKRPLTLSMIRALHTGLSIPAETLIQEGSPFYQDGDDVDWKKFPTSEIISHGWVTDLDPRTQQEEIMRNLAAQAGVDNFLTQTACFRQGTRRNAKDDSFALQAWILKVLVEAHNIKMDSNFNQSELNYDFLRKVVQLSTLSSGPANAKEYLQNKGIKLVIVPHLKRTYVDAVLLLEKGKIPVIGMSLRYDRIDYFWFTLLHELAHLALNHLTASDDCIIDDLELHNSLDNIEKEADKFAKEVLIPKKLWLASNAPKSAKIADIICLAREADIHQAIVAGRIRYEKKNYRLLSRYVGHGKIRSQFN
ncbi:type II toxin-antitoxin system HigA family antitoxin [Maridesulfovibrio ferrireducens]|uniref:helix-turn-helix domain-containing protein n=1 Tax=Maridesulfovibrio ferrireducens TaxID=246191 RepID=UPI001A2C77CA|nr:ImmA/IrrE family metallo-endopeptidase [Maridesulfovibrio ferrireducens]MBI9111123.1 ImmA/IrrE family metallo-endopeptidase [Maridesulfovibrio ferrireducens]